MTRTLQIAFFVVLAGVAGGATLAEDSWTAPLGEFTRALGEQRQAEAAAEPAYAPGRGGFDWSVSRPNSYVYDYQRRGLEFYLDLGRHEDMRYLEQRTASLTSHAFPGYRRTLGNMRSPDFYMEHQWMERELESQEYYRTWYDALWRYSHDRPNGSRFPQ